MTETSPSNEFVTDTMGLVLWLEKRKLPASVKTIYQAATDGETTIYIPSIVFAEILYLSEKKRISLNLADVTDHLHQVHHFQEAPMTLAIIQAASQITDIPELHDRLIAGTARSLNLPLITNDPVIQNSTAIQTQWA